MSAPHSTSLQNRAGRLGELDSYAADITVTVNNEGGDVASIQNAAQPAIISVSGKTATVALEIDFTKTAGGAAGNLDLVLPAAYASDADANAAFFASGSVEVIPIRATVASSTVTLSFTTGATAGPETDVPVIVTYLLA